MATDTDWTFDRPPSNVELVQNNFFSNGLRLILHALVRFSFRYYHRYAVVHAERLRGARAKILVANHASHLDVLALFSAFPLRDINRVRAFAAADYFFQNPLLRGLAFFFANAVPLERHGWSSEALSYAGRALDQGGVFIIFPEGTRSLDGAIHAFRPGIGRLAMKYRVEVVPVYIEGTYASQRKGACFPRPRKIRVLVGEALDFSARTNDRAGWEAIARELETRVKSLQEELRHAE